MHGKPIRPTDTTCAELPIIRVLPTDRLPLSATRTKMSRRWIWGLAGIYLLSGCAELTTRKVPVEARLTEKDANIHGFRYYLSRPYIVVSKAVSLGCEVKVGTLGYLGSDRRHLVLACQSSAGRVVYHWTDGNEVAEANFRGKSFTPLTRTAPAPDPAATNSTSRDDTPPVDNRTAPDRPKGDQPFPKVEPNRNQGRNQAPGSSGESGPLLAVSRERDIESSEEGGPPQVALADNRFGIIGLPSSPSISMSQVTAFQAGAAAENSAQTPESSMSVVMLPDFAEQMAIDDCNAGAYSTYSLRFKNGWQLTTVNGSWDATAVPVNILKVLGNAIGAAQDIKLAQLRAQAGPAAGAPQEVGFNVPDTVIRAVLIRKESIAPGIYKLLKPEEQAGGSAALGGGYFSELGIPSQFEVTVRLINAE